MTFFNAEVNQLEGGNCGWIEICNIRGSANTPLDKEKNEEVR